MFLNERHRCENILFDVAGNLKIVDFGFARSDVEPVNGKYLRSDTFCGSFAYAAPEILLGVPYIPQLADTWSCGIILYIMVGVVSAVLLTMKSMAYTFEKQKRDN